ncbi:unnamed protein product [Gongylonema pulchrum]|uniref:Uncharacterized protein n=1 Tax=Gongylonema pulchrum TaxID=637853 RepID=A0A183EUI4_9BILA|nr:unnamed protein product [Gongylonema pulchrum]
MVHVKLKIAPPHLAATEISERRVFLLNSVAVALALEFVSILAQERPVVALVHHFARCGTRNERAVIANPADTGSLEAWISDPLVAVLASFEALMVPFPGNKRRKRKTEAPLEQGVRLGPE